MILAFSAHADDDVLARLAAASDGALSSIPGCHVMEGTLRGDTDLGILGHQDAALLVRGTLRDGVWDGREVAPADGEWRPAGPDAVSAFGADPSVPPGTGWAQLLLRELPGAVSLQHAERRGEQWALVSTLDGGPRNTMVTLFDADPLRVRAIQARVESPIRGIEDGGHTIRIRKLALDLVFDAQGIPVSERIDASFGQGIFTGTTRLAVDWQARPCEPGLE